MYLLNVICGASLCGLFHYKLLKYDSMFCCVDSCEFFRDIKKNFFSSHDLKWFPWQEFFQHLSSLDYYECENHQDTFLRETVDSDLIKKYPIRKSLHLAFLKNCIQQAENNNIEFSKAYELYVALLNTTSSSLEETSYKHYFLYDNIITIKENNSLISGGTTGLCTWQAGIALANWCLHHPEHFSSKEIIELGCGSGLTGLVIIKSNVSPRRYTFTDCHPLVLKQLQQNLDINIPGKDFPRFFKDTFVNVCSFDWEDISENNLSTYKQADVIIAADVVFDPVLTNLLLNVLDKLLDSVKYAIVASTVRNQNTFDHFINELGSRNFNYSCDTGHYPELIKGNSNLPVNIVVIRKNKLMGA